MPQAREDRVEPRHPKGRSIRLKCLDCCGGQAAEVRLCTAYRCPLWEWRFGRPLREDDPNVEHWTEVNGEENRNG